ncbi:MAG: hypothetical protein Ct9H300mP27_10150 [Chloroflexota bacterium]|nr:MAG: hypothetical protein Ct9H300mP27_10150 [Chloroflexota bacterium]
MTRAGSGKNINHWAGPRVPTPLWAPILPSNLSTSRQFPWILGLSFQRRVVPNTGQRSVFVDRIRS